MKINMTYCMYSQIWPIQFLELVDLKNNTVSYFTNKMGLFGSNRESQFKTGKH